MNRSRIAGSQWRSSSSAFRVGVVPSRKSVPAPHASGSAEKPSQNGPGKVTSMMRAMSKA
ncbi:MAG: hypothetical protein JWN10_1412 [Solirubrobacterales bacterium]|nr:hypothetical protein [Solirubrobacterales bacterium]